MRGLQKNKYEEYLFKLLLLSNDEMIQFTNAKCNHAYTVFNIATISSA